MSFSFGFIRHQGDFICRNCIESLLDLEQAWAPSSVNKKLSSRLIQARAIFLVTNYTICQAKQSSWIFQSAFLELSLLDTTDCFVPRLTLTLSHRIESLLDLEQAWAQWTPDKKLSSRLI